jgi:hypothetical protein
VGKRWPRRLSECEPAHLETDGGVYMEWKLPCTVTRNADGTGSLLKKSGDTKPGDQTERNRRRYSSEYCFFACGDRSVCRQDFAGLIFIISKICQDVTTKF